MKLDQALSQGKQDRLRIDVGTSVMFKLDRMEEPVKAVLVGMSEGNYILLQPPASFVEQKKISEGEGILIRYMHGGTVYEFKSAVRRLQEEYDAAILTVAYPGVIKSRNIRRAKRVDCSLPSLVKIQDRDHRCLILDISETGCKVCLKTEHIPGIEVGDKIQVKWVLRGAEDVTFLDTVVRNMNRKRNNLHVGLEFLEPSPNVTKMIKSFVEAVAFFIE